MRQKKSYYTNGHKREDVAKDRNDRFLIEYFEAELRCHRWVQIPEYVTKLLEEKNEIFRRECSHNYVVSVHGVEKKFPRYHVDTHELVVNYVTAENIKYGGDLSVRRDATRLPLVMIG